MLGGEYSTEKKINKNTKHVQNSNLCGGPNHGENSVLT